MATIRQRNNTYCVIYSYQDENGKKKQKWESFKNLQEAKKRKIEIEYKTSFGTLTVPKCYTLNQLLDEYIELYGKNKWSMSTYHNNVALVDHYVRPFMGETQLSEITPRMLERYYHTLLKTEAVSNNAIIPKKKCVSAHTVHDIHKVLCSCFGRAVKWELMEKNPAANALPPKVQQKKRNIWTAELLFHALNLCEDPRLALALNLSFCCSLRMGEMLGLTWDCVDISSESIQKGMTCVQITKELQRVDRAVLDTLEQKDVQFVFPPCSSNTATVMVLKKPKTDSSIRKVFMPQAVAKMLISWKELQEQQKSMFGNEYKDYNLVFAGELGYPVEQNTINKALHRLIEKNNLPPVVFHSFRHASVTYKLKLNGGDIKSVQGDTGHAQTKMVTDVYSHILDDGRQNNAELFQKAFYENEEQKPETVPKISPTTQLPNGLTPEILTKLLGNPEVASLLGSLAKAIK